jgi:bacterioferritin
MRADPNVIEYLNKGLRGELTAMNQYWLHYRLLENWGYRMLAKKWHEESMESCSHTIRGGRDPLPFGGGLRVARPVRGVDA